MSPQDPAFTQLLAIIGTVLAITALLAFGASILCFRRNTSWSRKDGWSFLGAGILPAAFAAVALITAFSQRWTDQIRSGIIIGAGISLLTALIVGVIWLIRRAWHSMRRRSFP